MRLGVVSFCPSCRNRQKKVYGNETEISSASSDACFFAHATVKYLEMPPEIFPFRVGRIYALFRFGDERYFGWGSFSDFIVPAKNVL